MSPRAAIEADNLVKHFGETVAVDGVSLSVPEGTRAGHAGAQRRRQDHDRADDDDPDHADQRHGPGRRARRDQGTRRRAPQHGADRAGGDGRRAADRPGEPPPHRRALRPVAAYIKQATDDLLERFSLTDAGNRVVKTYSGGMRRRLDLAVSLVATPPVLFLDEPTTGLDPRSRVELWDVLRGLVADGTTLLLTTQYLEEADQLADRIVVIDQGRVIAEGTPLELKDQSGKAALVVTVSHAGRPADGRAACCATRVGEVHVDAGARQLTAPANGLRDMTRIAGDLRGQRDRARRPRPQATQPRRRLPAPDRPPGRGRPPTPTTSEEVVS